jgi:hypothetical protein
VRSTLPGLAAASLLAGSLGCASVPSTPGGPLQRAGTWQLGAGISKSFNRAHVSTSPGAEGRRTEDFAEVIRGGVRFAPADVLDVAVDVGFPDAGAEIRAGLPESTRLFPFAVSLAARSAALAPLAEPREVRDQRNIRGRLEIYPKLGTWDAGAGRAHAVLAVGASRGRQFHLSRHAGENTALLQWEDRLEAALGLDLRGDQGFFSVVALPHYIARAWGTEHVPYTNCILHCDELSREPFIEYRQGYSVTVLFTAGVTLGRGRNKP